MAAHHALGATSSTYRRLRRPLTAAERADTGGFRAAPIVDEGWATTVECAAVLSAAAILFQCPASFRPTEENVSSMRAFFGRIRRPAGARHVYSDAELRTLLDMLPAGETYVLFNNMPRIGDEERFIALLGQTGDDRT